MQRRRVTRKTAAYRILSVDGGGIRGLYAAVLLDRLARKVPTLVDRVDLVAGTSTGGIIALALAHGLAPADLVALYRDRAKEIFDDSWRDDLKDLGGLTGAEYDNGKLKTLLGEVFGKKTRLKHLRKRVLVPTFDLDNESPDPGKRMWKPKFFHNFPGPDSDGEELVVDVALRTSAAPTYFPTYQGYIDGAVVANNPAMAALAQALDAGTGKQALQDVRLFSLGTGVNPAYVAGKDLDWGYAQWAKPLIRLMVDGMMGVADYQCARLLQHRYFRLDPILPERIGHNDVDKIGDLVKYAKDVDIRGADAWLTRYFSQARQH
jgi:patatin-like phospholipase/acyl hydrolase